MLELYRKNIDPRDLPFFYPTDTRQQYVENLGTQVADWPWRDQLVRYTLNSQGYRCGEFDQIDWDRSILCFGCSFTFGVGVSDDQTWPYYLSQLMGCDVVNLAAAGSSIQFNWANSHRLYLAGIRPRAVLYYWPDPTRSCEFLGGMEVKPLGNWSDCDLARSWITRGQHYRELNSLYMSTLPWTCPRVDLSWSSELREFCGIYNRFLDRARDLVHPGPQTQAALARVFRDHLVKILPTSSADPAQV